MHARKFLFILGLLGFFNEGESFLDECCADWLFLVMLCVSLTTSIACLSFKSPNVTSLPVLSLLYYCIKKNICHIAGTVLGISGSGSDHVFFVFKGRMKDLERRVLGIRLESLVNLST